MVLASQLKMAMVIVGNNRWWHSRPVLASQSVATVAGMACVLASELHLGLADGARVLAFHPLVNARHVEVMVAGCPDLGVVLGINLQACGAEVIVLVLWDQGFAFCITGHLCNAAGSPQACLVARGSAMTLLRVLAAVTGGSAVCRFLFLEP